MREFLSQNSVEFEDRNIAKEPHWRKQVLELTGEIVVPVLVVKGQQVIGLDEQRMSAALGLDHNAATSNRDGLAAPMALVSLPYDETDPTKVALTHFVRRLQREMEFNALKEGSPYRDGQHDGMRFARDAILRMLTGAYEPEKMVIERESGTPS
ncbi:MAG: glutaredoxin family protein [Candidatus Dormibacteraceae bacterium]